MLCEKCRHLKQSVDIDKYHNIHIYWTCLKRFWSLYHQVTYNSQFLADLRNGVIWITVEGMKDILPYAKEFRDIRQIEIMFDRNVKKCHDYSEKLPELSRFLDKSTNNVT